MPKLATSGNVKSAERWESLSARIAIAANSVAPNSMIGPMTPILKIMRILGHEAFGHNLPEVRQTESESARQTLPELPVWDRRVPGAARYLLPAMAR